MKFDLLFNKNVTVKVLAIHVICWTTFIIYELVFLYYLSEKLEPAPVYLSYYCLNISFFYFNASLLNFVFSNRVAKYSKGLLLFLALFTCYFVLKFFIGYFTQAERLLLKPYFYFFVKFLPTTLLRIFYFIVLSTFYWATGHISNFRRQALEAEKQELIALKEKAELETRLAASNNAYLTQQLNPHLLFNTLSFIYNSVFENSPKAAECVLLLSDIMSFSLKSDSADGKVPLLAEIDQIERLVAINRYRYDKPLSIKVELTGCFEDFRIIPLLLFTLTENLFKHGNFLNPKHPALLTLSVDNRGQLIYHCSNLKKPGSEQLHGQQIGLKNVRLRLDFAYPGNYTLRITEDKDFYQIALIINL